MNDIENQQSVDVKSTIGEKKNKFLLGTHNHFSCFLPGELGFAPQTLFKLFFSGISVDKDQTAVLNSIPDDAIVVYAIKYKSYFEYFFYYSRYKQQNLPFPQIGFDYHVFSIQPLLRILRMMASAFDYVWKNKKFPDPYESDYIRQELENGRAGLLSLVERKGFHKRFIKSRKDPIRYLVEMQKQIDRPIYIVPQLMIFGKNPHRTTLSLIDILFGTEENPGKLRRFYTMFKKPGKVFVEISEPFNLKEILEQPEYQEMDVSEQSMTLRQKILAQVNKHRQSITGPVLRSKEELKENILTSERLRNYMQEYAELRETPLYKVNKEASGYLDEIAAKYSPSIIKMFSWIVEWISKHMYDGFTVNHEVLNRVKTMSIKGPLILVPCHKSHIDYMMLSYVLYHNNMPCPHVAAGKNLSFWPIGPLFRGGGAFFIRRTFKGAILYSKVFAEYVYKLLEHGFNVEFFIEGGRSRTGKLLQPKLGLLSILLNAYKDGACDDLIFVPVFIGYDRVLEESAYLYELDGGQKKPESLMQVLKARKFLRKRHGRIYIMFHDPVSLKQYLSGNDLPRIENMTSKEFNTMCRSLGNKLVNAIDSVTVATPHAVVAAALLNCQKHWFSYDNLMSNVETYMNYLFARNVKLADTLLMDPVNAFEYVFDVYIQRKFIERIPKDRQGRTLVQQFMVNENKRKALDYYKNNCISFFVSAAYTAMAIIGKDAFVFSISDLSQSYLFYQELFKNEFSHDEEKSTEDLIQENIKIFIEDAILMPHPTLTDTYNLTSAGFRKLKLYAGFLKTYMESYWVVLNYFMENPKNTIDAKERSKKIVALGNRMYKTKEIQRFESLSEINYRNAVDYFMTAGVKGSEDSENIEYYSSKIKKDMERLA